MLQARAGFALNDGDDDGDDDAATKKAESDEGLTDLSISLVVFW